tara:strand:- start:605 stop:1129 length:525 start_codon:yes stop_codon:yes gene_type:complete
MALTVEDGSGMSDADAYVSVSFADTYFTNRQGSSVWNDSSLTTEDKEAAIRNATAYLDRRYSGSWVGRRINRSQSLAFPRMNVTDYDGFTIGADEIPTKLAEACCEGAVLAIGEDLLPDITNSGIISEETVGIGSVQSTIKYEGGKSQIKTYRKIATLLRGLVLFRGTIQMERG